MGIRHFHPVEQKNSRIKWERADAETARRLILALGKQRQGLRGVAVWFALLFPVAIILAILGIYVKVIMENHPTDSMFNIVFYLFFALCLACFSIFLLVRYLRYRPYLYPEKQSEIWIFRAKCADISMTWNGQEHQRYYAYFQKGGIHISIPIPWSVHRANPKGKEYIFYKFNDQTGNRWAAIAVDELDQV